METLEKESKEAKNVRLTPLPSAGPSTETKSSALSLSRMVQIETMSKDIEKIKTSIASMSLQGNKSLDINSDNVNRWVQGKFEAMLRTPDSRNQIREIVDSKVEAYQVIYYQQ